jgi:adenylate kinase family enzyme
MRLIGKMGAGQSAAAARPLMAKYFTLFERNTIDLETRNNKAGLISRLSTELGKILLNERNASRDDIVKRDLYIRVIKTLIAKKFNQTGAVITLPPEVIVQLNQVLGDQSELTKEIVRELGASGSVAVTKESAAKVAADLYKLCKSAPLDVQEGAQVGTHQLTEICRLATSNRSTPGYSSVMAAPAAGGRRRPKSKKSKKSQKQKKSRKSKKTRRN